MAFLFHEFRFLSSSLKEEYKDFFLHLAKELKEKRKEKWIFQEEENAFFLGEEKNTLKEDYTYSLLLSKDAYGQDVLSLSSSPKENEKKIRSYLFSSLRTRVIFSFQIHDKVVLDISPYFSLSEKSLLSSPLIRFLDDYLIRIREENPTILISFSPVEGKDCSSFKESLLKYFSYSFDVEWQE